MRNIDLEQFTFEHMPEALFGKLLQAVFVAYKVATEDCRRDHEPTEAKNVLPYHRRAKIESFTRASAEMFPGLISRVVLGDGGWNHTEVRGGPVVLTSSYVQSPCAIVRKAEFRKTLALDNQARLFPEDGDIPPEDAPLYVLLLHSESHWDTTADYQAFGHLPGSAYVAYPSPSFDTYVHEIDLFERFPDVVASNAPQSWDNDAVLRYMESARRANAA